MLFSSMLGVEKIQKHFKDYLETIKQTKLVKNNDAKLQI